MLDKYQKLSKYASEEEIPMVWFIDLIVNKLESNKGKRAKKQAILDPASKLCKQNGSSYMLNYDLEMLTPSP